MNIQQMNAYQVRLEIERAMAQGDEERVTALILHRDELNRIEKEQHSKAPAQSDATWHAKMLDAYHA